MPTETFTNGTTGSIDIGLSQTVTIKCWGERAWYGDGTTYGGPGKGGYIKSEIDVSAGDTLYIRYTNGGAGQTVETKEDKDGNTNSATTWDGGRSASVRLNGTSLSDRVVVAGGGGSGSSMSGNLDADKFGVGAGGHGGPLQAEDGETGTDDTGTTADGGDGGTQNSGFALGSGGQGASKFSGEIDVGVGGNGGAGYYGGSGGQVTLNPADAERAAGGGGGGSNFSSGTILKNQRGVKYNVDGHPAVKVTYETGFPIYIDNQQVKEITIDGQKVSDVTIDGTTL